MLRGYYLREHGSEKGYIFLKMQAAVILALVISIAYAFLGNLLLIVLQALPLALLAGALAEMRRSYHREFAQNAMLFSALFAASAFGPPALRYMLAFQNPFAAVRYMIYVLVGLVACYLLYEAKAPRRQVEGRVLLADRQLAVVELEYDFISRIRAGKYAVSNRGARKGQRVRVAIRKGLFRPAVPDAVAEVLG